MPQTVRSRAPAKLHVFVVDGEHHTDVASLIKELEALPGVRRVEYNQEARRLMVLGRVTADVLHGTAEKLGFVLTEEQEDEQKPQAAAPVRKWELRFPRPQGSVYWAVGVLVICFAAGMLLSLVSLSRSLAVGLFTGIVLVAGIACLMLLKRRGLRVFAYPGSSFPVAVYASVVIPLGAILVRGAWVDGIIAGLLVFALHFTVIRTASYLDGRLQQAKQRVYEQYDAVRAEWAHSPAADEPSGDVREEQAPRTDEGHGRGAPADDESRQEASSGDPVAQAAAADAGAGGAESGPAEDEPRPSAENTAEHDGHTAGTITATAGDVIPADGRVLAGSATVQWTVLTDERIPDVRGEGDPVYAGMEVVDGKLLIRVDSYPKEGLLERLRPDGIVAATRNSVLDSPRGVLARRVSLGLLYLALAAALLPPLFFGRSVGDSVWRALLLCIAAPAVLLKMASALPLMAARFRAAELGFLFDAPTTLTRLGGVSRLVVTQSLLMDARHILLAVESLGKLPEETCLQYAASLYAGTRDAVGRAIAEGAAEREISLLTLLERTEVAGYGIQGTIADGDTLRTCQLGTTLWMRQQGFILPADADERIEAAAAESSFLLWLAVDGVIEGVLTVSERLRDGSRRLIDRIKGCGVKTVALVTAAEKNRARRIAEQTGIDEVHAELGSEQQSALVQGWIDDGEQVAWAFGPADAAAVLSSRGLRIVLTEEREHMHAEAYDIVAVARDGGRLLPLVSLCKRLVRTSRMASVFAWAVQIGLVAVALRGTASLWTLAGSQFVAGSLILLQSRRLARHRR